MWILIDNYDSFSYMLLHCLQQVHAEVRVVRNDECSASCIAAMNPERIIISPGPRRPADSGITNEVIRDFHKDIPMLGICLGHQALGEYYGATLKKAVEPRHGKVSGIDIVAGHEIFDGLGEQSTVMRYHSLVLTNWEDTELVPLALSTRGELMAFSHPKHPSIGLQFHPESILTPDGERMIQNWASIRF